MTFQLYQKISVYEKCLCKNTYFTMYNLLTKYVFSNRGTSILVWYIGYKKKSLSKKKVVSSTHHTIWHQWKFHKLTGVAKSLKHVLWSHLHESRTIKPTRDHPKWAKIVPIKWAGIAWFQTPVWQRNRVHNAWLSILWWQNLSHDTPKQLQWDFETNIHRPSSGYRSDGQSYPQRTGDVCEFAPVSADVPSLIHNLLTRTRGAQPIGSRVRSQVVT